MDRRNDGLNGTNRESEPKYFRRTVVCDAGRHFFLLSTRLIAAVTLFQWLAACSAAWPCRESVGT
jgi:hypothetical protein